MGHGRAVRKLREPGDLKEMHQFANQAAIIVDPTSNRSEGVLEKIGMIRNAYLNAEKAIEKGADEEKAIKEEYEQLIDNLED